MVHVGVILVEFSVFFCRFIDRAAGEIMNLQKKKKNETIIGRHVSSIKYLFQWLFRIAFINVSSLAFRTFS